MAKNGCIKNNQKIVTKNKRPEVLKTIVILTRGRQNDRDFELRTILSKMEGGQKWVYQK